MGGCLYATWSVPCLSEPENEVDSSDTYAGSCDVTTGQLEVVCLTQQGLRVSKSECVATDITFTLISQVQAGRGIFFFFLRILSTLARVSLGLPPVRYSAPSSRCNSTSRAWITGVLHSKCGK